MRGRLAPLICTRIKIDLNEVYFVAYIKEEPKLRQWKACEMKLVCYEVDRKVANYVCWLCEF